MAAPGLTVISRKFPTLTMNNYRCGPRRVASITASFHFLCAVWIL